MLETIASNVLVRTAILVAVFAMVISAVLMLFSHLDRRRALKAQLERIKGDSGIIEAHSSLRTSTNDGAWSRMAAAIEAAGLDLTDTKNDRLVVCLRAAGFKSPMAPKIFTLSRLLLLFALPGGYVALASLGGGLPSFAVTYAVCALLALLGLYMPNLFVQARADRRREEITNGFPDCLDLLIICVESGLGIEAAMDRVGREMIGSHPLVAELMSVTTLHLRAGASREDAFRKMAEVAGVREVSSFTTLLIQSDKLGTSITTTLRVYAAEMREKRSLHAEERAHRLPVLISIPLVACMLPVMIGTMMLPATIRIVRDVLPMITGN